jgi:hypothetical protein
VLDITGETGKSHPSSQGIKISNPRFSESDFCEGYMWWKVISRWIISQQGQRI